jgi:hypothetical protein
MRHATVLGAGALIASAMPLAEQMMAAQPALAFVTPDDATLQAFADTVIPGRKADRTDLGNEIHPQAIAGVDPAPGAVEADTLALMKDPRIGFVDLAPAFLLDLEPRALSQGGDFLSLSFDKRVAVLLSGLDYGNGSRTLWEAAAAVPFAAFCAAAVHQVGTSANASGYRVMGYPGAAPNGYAGFSYGKPLSKERTKRGVLP